MTYRGPFKWDTIKTGLQQRLDHGLEAARKSGTLLKTKTGEVAQSSIRQIIALQKKSKERLKKVFRKAA